jgi:flagellar biogenesis protein FliO
MLLTPQAKSSYRLRIRPCWCPSRSWLSGIAFCWLLGSLNTIAQTNLLSTNLPATSPALPEAGFSIVRVFGALVLVLALFLGGVWLFKNWHRLAGKRARCQNLQLLESRSLGGRHALYVVGYQGQRLLLASSPTGVSLISHLPAVGAPEPETDKGDKGGHNHFVQVLQQAIQQKP